MSKTIYLTDAERVWLDAFLSSGNGSPMDAATVVRVQERIGADGILDAEGAEQAVNCPRCRNVKQHRRLLADKHTSSITLDDGDFAYVLSRLTKAGERNELRLENARIIAGVDRQLRRAELGSDGKGATVEAPPPSA